MNELVLSMRLADYGDWYDPPYEYRVHVVTGDGMPIPPSNGGDWPNQQLHEWTYDITGEARAGFLITANSACHGWGGPVIVERVFAR